MIRVSPVLASLCLFASPVLNAAESAPAAKPENSGGTGLQAVHTGRLQPAYPFSYNPASEQEIREVLSRVLGYMELQTPIGIMDADTRKPVPEGAPLPARPSFVITPLQNVSYEWGVTYAGLLNVWAVTGDTASRDYVAKRFEVIRTLSNAYLKLAPADRGKRSSIRGLVMPDSLDACGAMAAAMLKARLAGVGPDLKPLIDIDLEYIARGQQRLDDRTLSRSRPMPDTLWLDDLYMSIPALAQMGKLTGDVRYFDDAARQLLQFADRMFVKEKGLFMHGWVKGMQEHPAFHWGRANGWAIMANVELLSVLPEEHPQRPALLQLLRAHARGLAAVQGNSGLWHQLLDRNDTYEESSASAMFVFAFARAMNRGWLDPLVYGPAASLGWNAVAAKVNAKGGVEATCVGTGMGWEPAFYAYRPTHVDAAHGYGPVLLAGAEMIALRRGAGAKATVHDGGVHFAQPAELLPWEAAAKPLYRDPKYDGAADTVLAWSQAEKQWLMFYTNRRANVGGLSGVTWVHGTPIGIASSKDRGLSWQADGTADIDLPESIGGKEATLWAPEIVRAPDGVYHMILTVVPGVFEDWKHPRVLVHLTSSDLRHWGNAKALTLSGDRLIDACLLRLDDGTWRMWYNNERDGKSIYYAESKDLDTWVDHGKVVADQAGEGPKVFRWKGYYWMITDVWKGLAVYRSTDALTWTRQAGPNLVQAPGKGVDDGVVGRHADVVINGDRAFLFYFTHPGHALPKETRPELEERRSSIQVTELVFANGLLSCDRDKPVAVDLGTGL